MNSFGINFQSMLISPLLTFLTNALLHHYHTIVAQTSDDWLGNACSCAYLSQTWLMADQVNYIGHRTAQQLFGRNDCEG